MSIFVHAITASKPNTKCANCFHHEATITNLQAWDEDLRQSRDRWRDLTLGAERAVTYKPQSREPRPIYCLPNGRGRHPRANVPSDFAAHRGTAVAATASAGVRRSMVMRSRATKPDECVSMSGKIPQMRPANAVRTVWNAGAIDTSHPASGQSRRLPLGQSRI